MILRRFVKVRDDEVGALVASFLYFFCLLTAYTTIRPIRDEMGIAGGVEKLPWLFTATFVVVLIAVPLWSSLVARVARRTLIPIVYRFFIANLVVFFLLFQGDTFRTETARVFFVWTSVFNLMAVTIFWSFMADVFAHEQAKRLFGFIAAGGSAGAIVGPLVTSTLVGAVGPTNLLLLSAALLEAATRCARRLDAWQRRRALHADVAEGRPVGGGPWSGIKLVFASPYLRIIALYAFCAPLLGTFGYLLQARLMATSGMTPALRTALFARVDLLANAITILGQTFVTGWLLSRVGVKVALAIMPPLAALAFGLQALWPTVAVSSAMQVLRRGMGYAIVGPATQVLYTVVTREQKYKSKAFIDTVVYRAADVTSAWSVTGIAALGIGIAGSAVIAIPLAAVWLAVAVVLGRRHDRAARAAVD